MGVPLRVLMIEDSEDDADLVMRELKRGGYRPTCERVETADAMRAALEKGGWWDIALCDYAMAQFDAPAALVLWQESGSEQPFIVVSGAIGEEVAVVLMKAGVHDYVKKDNLTRLVPVIERELQAAEVRRERKQAEAALQESEARFRELAERARIIPWVADAGTWRFQYVGPQTIDILGYPQQDWCRDHFWAEHIHPEDREWALAFCADSSVNKDNYEFEYRMVSADGNTVWLHDIVNVVREAGSPTLLAGYMIDITERKRAAILQSGRNKMLERMAAGAPLDEVLSILLRSAEEMYPGLLASVLLLDKDKRRLRPGAAPSLPDFYNDAIDGLEIGPAVGSCGTAAYTAQRMVVTDIMTHPYWVEYRELAKKAGLRACWSEPIVSADGDVLGTFAMYYRESREPDPSHLDFIKTAAHLAGIAIERKQTEEALQRSYHELEKRVEERTAELSEANARLTQGIAERKRAEETLHIRERQLRAFFRNSSADINIKDAEGRYVLTSRQFEKTFGLAEGEAIGKLPHEVFPSEFADVVRAHDLSVLKTGQLIEKEHVIPNSQTVQSVSKFPISDGSGSVVGIGVIAIDITERKRAEEALRASEDRFRSLIENASDVIATTNTDGVITYESPALERMLGYKPEEYVGKTVFGYMHPDDVPTLHEAYKRLIVNPGSVERTVHRHRHKDGSWRVLESIRKSIAENGVTKEIVINARDITEHKHTEQRLRETVRELARSNADLGQFAHVASHDLQEPLRMVASYTALLRKRYQGKLDADADEFIEFAVDGATRMRGLIDDLLAYSRVGTQGKVSTLTDCQAVFDQVTRNLQVAIEENGAVVTHNSLPTVMADETQLVQLFQNLIGNAIKFHGEEAPRVHVSVKEDANECIFAVCDNGIGIDREYAERIFVIFKRLHEKDEYPGTGIGLAICKKIVDRHSGRIWVDSESGKGSTFYFALPRERGR